MIKLVLRPTSHIPQFMRPVMVIGPCPYLQGRN